MRATEFLIERISSRVFHYTRVTTALKILQSGQFELSHTLGTSWEAQFAPKGYPYFLSTTRTRHGGYHGYLGQDAVLFELDGDFYNQRYPGKAVDYWNNRDPMKDHHKAHEAEDRIFSRENAIPAAIKVIDLYIAPDADEAARARTRQVIILAKKAGIPVNLFNDQAAWRQRDTRKTADVGQLKGQDPARGYVERRRGGYLKPWMELMQAKTKAQLSKDADRKRYDLQYTYDKQGLAKSLAVDLSNARKPGPDADRNNAIRIIQFMQQNRLSTVEDFVNFLADKWKNIKEGVAEGVMSDLDQDRQDANWDAIVGYVINGLKKNQDVGHMELALYKWGGKELVDVDQELEDRGFRDLADLASHIQQHGGQYQPPKDFGLDGLGRDVT